MKCKNCGVLLNDGSIVCSGCGTVMEENFPGSGSGEMTEKIGQCAERLSEMSKAAYDLSACAWNAQIKRYMEVMTRTRAVMASDMFMLKSAEKQEDPENAKKTIDKYLDNIDTFLKKCSSEVFQIALIGVVKAGKSTLMNAITGCDAASTNVTPETASLTKFRASGTDENYVKVRFYSANEWNEIWKSANEKKDKAEVFLQEYNDLKADTQKDQWLGHEEVSETFSDFDLFKREVAKWTSAKAPEHYFVKEVEIGLSTLKMPREIVFVDTPGLNDPVEYRSNITRTYIKEADAVVVCVQATALTEPEKLEAAKVFSSAGSMKEKVFFVATKCDNLNDPTNEWNPLRADWIKHLEKPGYFGSTVLAEKNIIPTAAYLYNLLEEYKAGNIDNFKMISILAKYRKGLEALKDPKTLEELYERTGIDYIKSRLKTDIIEKSQKIKEKELEEDYEACAESIKKAMEGEINYNRDTLAKLEKSKEELIKDRKEMQKELKEHRAQAEEAKNSMRSVISQVREQIDQLIEQVERISAKFSA